MENKSGIEGNPGLALGVLALIYGLGFLSLFRGVWVFKAIGLTTVMLAGFSTYHIIDRAYLNKNQEEGHTMANMGALFVLFAFLFVAGAAMFFNLPEVIWGVDMDMGWNQFASVQNFIWMVVMKVVGLALMGIPIWVGVELYRNS